METEILTLIERRFEYDGVFTYIFRPAHPVPFEAGQYVHLRIPSMPEGTRRVHELSFASSPQDTELWFGIDGRSGSAYQKALQALAPGEAVELFKIRGHLTWPPERSSIVMIAGGVGVTPFRSMLRDRAQRNLPLTTTLVHISSGPTLYNDELKELADEYIHGTRSTLPQIVEQVCAHHADAHFYVAGSNDFVGAVMGELIRKDIQNVEHDEFIGLSPLD